MFSNFAASDVGTTQPVKSLVIVCLAYGVYKISTFIYNEVTSPLRDVPGPPSPSFIYGNTKELSASNNTELHDKWIEKYGTTIQFRGMLGISRLMTTDLKAISYMLCNNYDYPKPEIFSNIIRQLIGNGLITAEGDVHKHQRKILNPAFGPQQLRALTEIFVEKAIELRDIWGMEIARHDGACPIEGYWWMTRLNLDTIGLGGFNYKFNALSTDPEENELMKAFLTIVPGPGTKASIIPMLKAMYPPLRFLPTPDHAGWKKASAVMGSVGARLLKESKGSKGGTKLSSSRKDILSLLVKANTMQDLPEAQRLTDEVVIAQIPTFIIAGNETGSIAMTWALYALAQNKHVQGKLRQELSKMSTDHPTMDELNGLPYLDAVVREILRLYPPVSGILRVAKKDDCIPLGKPFTDTKGISRNEIRVRKGQWIFLPILLINRDKSIWGYDSTEFKPERWENVPSTAASVPGVWANTMTFLGGPRSCIGYRFSLVEIKAMLFTFIRAFEFDLAVSAEEIGTKPTGFLRPILLTGPSSNSNQVPLIVRPAPSNL